MGCAKSKNRSHDDIYSGEEMEGHASRYEGTRKSNDSLIITVLWRRLSLFSRRGSSRKHSVFTKTASSSMKSMALAKTPEAGAAESLGPEEQQELGQELELAQEQEQGQGQEQEQEQEQEQGQEQEQEQEELEQEQEQQLEEQSEEQPQQSVHLTLPKLQEEENR